MFSESLDQDWLPPIRRKSEIVESVSDLLQRELIQLRSHGDYESVMMAEAIVHLQLRPFEFLTNDFRHPFTPPLFVARLLDDVVQPSIHALTKLKEELLSGLLHVK
jgi:hypothetical protein